MWPREFDWSELEFGVELEFVEAQPADVALVPGWCMDPAETQLSRSGR